MDRECNCYISYKVNGECVYKGKSRNKFLIYEVKLSMCEDIYIANTQQKFKKIMGGHLSNFLRVLKNGHISDSFAAHLEQHFNATTSR